MGGDQDAGDGEHIETEPDSDGWISLHIFYAANANPVLVHCVRPLVARLRGRYAT
ncbi:hypothetical protein ACFQ0G_10060 [Streptomyces chiangmaiensis]|uniref:hypothetical protein n=1 Tax=Streptomyces chiangmaiensis TaxID=766497 RepID=UPI0031E64B5A